MGLGFPDADGVLALTRLGVVDVDRLRRSPPLRSARHHGDRLALPTLDPVTLLEMAPRLLLLCELSVQGARLLAPRAKGATAFPAPEAPVAGSRDNTVTTSAVHQVQIIQPRGSDVRIVVIQTDLAVGAEG